MDQDSDQRPSLLPGAPGYQPSQLPFDRRPMKILSDLDHDALYKLHGKDPDRPLTVEEGIAVFRKGSTQEITRSALSEERLQKLGDDPDPETVRRSISAPSQPPLKKLCRGNDADSFTKFFGGDPNEDGDGGGDDAMDLDQELQPMRLTGLAAMMHALMNDDAPLRKERRATFDLISSVGSNTILLVEMCKYLPPRDIIKLYSISKVCHETIDSYLTASVNRWAQFTCLEASRVFSYGIYPSLCVPDPMGRRIIDRTQARDPTGRPATTVRPAPSLRWLTMVEQRHRRTRDILACLARNGHRTPHGMALTLMKLWLVLDCATNEGRLRLVAPPDIFADADVYNAQLFLVKLNMRFNEPYYGPGNDKLTRLILGQRGGMNLLWRMLRGGTLPGVKEGRTPDPMDVQRLVQMKALYDIVVEDEGFHEVGLPMFGVPYEKVGTGHTEHWGEGSKHLLRLDELMPIVAARRNLRIDDHLTMIVVWGHIDFATGQNRVPSVEELYMSDDELLPAGNGPLDKCGNVPFQQWEWQPWHAMKRCWKTLTDEEKQAVYEVQDNEVLGMQAWNHYSEFDGDESDYDTSDDEGLVGAAHAPNAEELDSVELSKLNKRLFNPKDNRPPVFWPPTRGPAITTDIKLGEQEQALVDRNVAEITRELVRYDQFKTQQKRSRPVHTNSNSGSDVDMDGDDLGEDEEQEEEEEEEDEWEDAYQRVLADEAANPTVDVDADGDADDESDEDYYFEDDDAEDGLTKALVDEVLDEPEYYDDPHAKKLKLKKKVFAYDYRLY